MFYWLEVYLLVVVLALLPLLVVYAFFAAAWAVKTAIRFISQLWTQPSRENLSIIPR